MKCRYCRVEVEPSQMFGEYCGLSCKTTDRQLFQFLADRRGRETVRDGMIEAGFRGAFQNRDDIENYVNDLSRSNILKTLTAWRSGDGTDWQEKLANRLFAAEQILTPKDFEVTNEPT